MTKKTIDAAEEVKPWLSNKIRDPFIANGMKHFIPVVEGAKDIDILIILGMSGGLSHVRPTKT